MQVERIIFQSTKGLKNCAHIKSPSPFPPKYHIEIPCYSAASGEFKKIDKYKIIVQFKFPEGGLFIRHHIIKIVCGSTRLLPRRSTATLTM